MTVTNNAEPEIEVIEVIEEFLDNKMAVMMLALGAVAGGIVFYLWMESKKGSGIPRLGVVKDIEYLDDDSDDDNEAEGN